MYLVRNPDLAVPPGATLYQCFNPKQAPALCPNPCSLSDYRLPTSSNYKLPPTALLPQIHLLLATLDSPCPCLPHLQGYIHPGLSFRAALLVLELLLLLPLLLSLGLTSRPHRAPGEGPPTRRAWPTNVPTAVWPQHRLTP